MDQATVEVRYMEVRLVAPMYKGMPSGLADGCPLALPASASDPETLPRSEQAAQRPPQHVRRLLLSPRSTLCQRQRQGGTVVVVNVC